MTALCHPSRLVRAGVTAILTTALLGLLAGYLGLHAWGNSPGQPRREDAALVEAEPPGVVVEGEAAVVTDRGTLIPIYLHPPQEQPNDELSLLKQFRLSCRVVRTAPADLSYSCHGWVFTAERCHLSGEDVELILRENGYCEVPTPQVGDVIIYRDSQGAVRHSGVVRVAEPAGLVLVESKWGGAGRYLHCPDDGCYGHEYRYYHSPRQGHRLRTVFSSE